jgi:hypothetical protein
MAMQKLHGLIVLGDCFQSMLKGVENLRVQEIQNLYRLGTYYCDVMIPTNLINCKYEFSC